MRKTKKSIAKRFKVTGRGKILRRTPGRRHLLGAKSTKQKRQSRPRQARRPRPRCDVPRRHAPRVLNAWHPAALLSITLS